MTKNVDFSKDYYRVLGLDSSASKEEIQSGYRNLAKKVHPDVSKADGAVERFKEVQDAYDILKDPSTKKLYDSTRSATVATPHRVDFQYNPLERENQKIAREQGRKTARNLHIFETVTRPKSILLIGLPLLFAGFLFTGKEEDNQKKYQSVNPETGRLKRRSDTISLYQNPKTKEWVRPDPSLFHTGVYNGWRTKSVRRKINSSG